MAEPALKQQEAPTPSVPILKERWTQAVALTTTILAVCASISALKGGGHGSQIQLLTTKANDAWAFYQSKSIKQHAAELSRDQLQVLALEVRAPEARQLAEAKIAAAEKDIARYDGEKKKIQAEAEGYVADAGQNARHAKPFGLAVMLLQIAIMLSSVAALMKKPLMWGVGLVFGLAGLVYMVNGFWLFF